MKPLLLPAALALILAFSLPTHAQTIADWTFETTAPVTAGPFSPEIGTGLASGFHLNTSTYSSPAGNGSSHSFSSNTWSASDYYQFQVSTLNLTNITLSFDQTSSSTGPGSFQLEYSTNGSTFTNIGSAYTVLNNGGSPNASWNSTTSSAAYTVTPSLSSISSSLANDPTLYFRLADASTISASGGSVGTGGTDRVDNVVISGTAIAAPEPSSWTLGLAALSLFAFIRSRRFSARNL